MVALSGMRGDYYVGLGFFPPFIFWRYFVHVSDELERNRRFFLCVCVFKQLLQVAVVDSVPTFGEDFFLKLRR